MLEAMFSVRSLPRLCIEDQSVSAVRVEAGLNTSTVALRVVGGDEKETSARGYNWATLLLRDTKYGDLALQVGDSRT
jgi:hypothetical protein